MSWGFLLHPDTICKRAHESGLFDRVAGKMPFVNKVSRPKRLRFAKEMLKKPVIRKELSAPTKQSFKYFPQNYGLENVARRV